MADQYFANSSGDFVNSTGSVVTDPTVRLQISQSVGGDIGKLPVYKTPSMDSLTPATAIQVPTAQPTANPLEATSAGAQATSKSLDQYIAELTPKPTETSKQYDKLTSDLSALLPGLTGRGTDQLQAEADSGIQNLKTKLADLNSQILSKVAEANKTNASYEQIIQQIENQQGVPMSIITGQQAQQRKLQLAEANSKSADLGLLQAVASGLQGNIQAMQSGIDRAIDLKYQDRESEVNLKMEQLKLLEGKLNKEEAIQKTALERKYADEQAKIAEEKAKAKENISLAFSGNVQTNFVNKNGEFFDARTGQGFASPADFFKAAGVSSFEQAYQRGLVTDLTPERIADIDFVSQLRAKYPDAGITINDTASTASQKLAKSRIYQDQVRPPVSAGGGSKTGVLGLTNQQIDNISPLVTQYQNNDIVKEYTTIGTAINAVRSLGNSPTDDIQRIYAFAKIMDPNSAVREGEYKTVQDYATAVMQRAGLNAKRVFTNSGFLTDQARGFLLNTLENRFKASETTYNQLTSETARRINLVGNTDKGDQLLNSYGGTFKPTAPITETWSTPGVAQELTNLARAKGYTDKEMAEMQQKGYSPAQVRDLLK